MTEGIPFGLVAALAVLVLAAILYTVATREPKEPRGYAEFTLYSDSCLLDRTRQMNATACVSLGRGVYRLFFTKPLDGTTPVASRGSCCMGRIAASIEAPRIVLVVVPPRVRDPIRASVVLP